MARPKAFTDEALKAAARQVFLKQGRRASVATIAGLLGVTSAAVFHRINSKERLLKWALLHEETPELAVLLAGPVQGIDAEGQLVEILAGLASHFFDMAPALFLEGTGLAGGQAGEGTVTRPDRSRRSLEHWLQQRAARGELAIGNAGTVAELLLGAVESRAMWDYLHGIERSATETRTHSRGLVREVLGARPADTGLEPLKRTGG